MSDIKVWFPEEAKELDRLKIENEGLKAELAMLHHKDELRTKEHNILVQENRKLIADWNHERSVFVQQIGKLELEIDRLREDAQHQAIERDLNS